MPVTDPFRRGAFFLSQLPKLTDPPRYCQKSSTFYDADTVSAAVDERPRLIAPSAAIACSQPVRIM